jgi:hypothetical protein
MPATGPTAMKHLIAIALLLASLMPVRAQEDEQSANYWLPFCQAALDIRGSYSPASVSVQARCLRAIADLLYANRNICVPHDALSGQAIRLVVAYIQARPERMQEDFMDLANEALLEGWPCSER